MTMVIICAAILLVVIAIVLFLNPDWFNRKKVLVASGYATYTDKLFRIYYNRETKELSADWDGFLTPPKPTKFKSSRYHRVKTTTNLKKYNVHIKDVIVLINKEAAKF